MRLREADKRRLLWSAQGERTKNSHSAGAFSSNLDPKRIVPNLDIIQTVFRGAHWRWRGVQRHWDLIPFISGIIDLPRREKEASSWNLRPTIPCASLYQIQFSFHGLNHIRRPQISWNKQVWGLHTYCAQYGAWTPKMPQYDLFKASKDISKKFVI